MFTRHDGLQLPLAAAVAAGMILDLVFPAVAILSDPCTVPETVRAPVGNDLGGHWNHSFYWELKLGERVYYLKYQNKWADYLAVWWITVNWETAAANFAKAPA